MNVEQAQEQMRDMYPLWTITLVNRNIVLKGNLPNPITVHVLTAHKNFDHYFRYEVAAPNMAAIGGATCAMIEMLDADSNPGDKVNTEVEPSPN